MQPIADAPYFFPGSEHGCLVLHGYGGSPAEARPLGEHLAAAGFTVAGARLAGHGGTETEFYASSCAAWLESAGHAFDELAGRCSTVVIVGFSLGGSLAIQLAQTKPVAGIVTMGSRVLPVQRSARWRIRHALDRWRDPWYAANQQLKATVADARLALGHVNAPALVMQGRLDASVTLDNAPAIFEGLASERKELVMWEETGHQMLESGPHREEIFARVIDFVRAVSVSP